MDVVEVNGDTDQALLQRVGTGDDRALACLYSRYGRAVFNFVRARVADAGVAEEISADTWLGCWRSAATFRGDSQVLTWLLAIAKRQIWSRTRGVRVPMAEFDESVHDRAMEEPDPMDQLISNEQTQTLLRALEQLPGDLAETVSLAWVHELPYGEVAQATGVPIGTVKSRVSRARHILRETLRSNDE